MKIGIIQFPGSNCARETKLAIERIGFIPIDCYWHNKANLISGLDGYVIVGGFSYEDRVRSGLIASLDPFMDLLKQEAEKGKPILGICNGAQILVESGFMPQTALTVNKRLKGDQLLGTGFYNEWVYIKSNDAAHGEPLRIPVAHGEGRFLIDPKAYQLLMNSQALCYYYCDEQGIISDEFPINPNGSMYNLAAISNAQGNVLAMMPHPERTREGDSVFFHFFTRSFVPQYHSQPTLNSNLHFNSYTINQNAEHFWVALTIYDNEAISLETALQAMGLNISLKKCIHWQIEGVTREEAQAIGESDELFHRKKEHLLDINQLKSNVIYILRQKEDEYAQSKQAALQKWLQHPVSVIREVVWLVEYPQNDDIKIKTVLERQNILGNPLAHEAFIYEAR